MTLNKENNNNKIEREKEETSILQEENHFKHLLALPVAVGYQQRQSLPLAGEGLLLGNATTVAEISRVVLGRVLCQEERP